MSEYNQNDEYASLTGTNQFEMLLFSLGISNTSRKSELFGINVLKIREILTLPNIVPIAGGGEYALGVAHLRGQVVPVYDLPAIVGCKPKTDDRLMLVTEYSRTTQAFTVASVEDIAKLEWDRVISNESTGVGRDLVTSIARLDEDEENSRLVQVLDVEAILELVTPEEKQHKVNSSTVDKSVVIKPGTVAIVADDSYVARALMQQTLETMDIPCEVVKTGQEAWDRLNVLADEAKQAGKPLQDKVSFVLTDLEMPEMDGFTLTRKIKQNNRFSHVPVVIHSSLSGMANENHAQSVGANGYVSKFSAEELSRTIHDIMREDSPA